MNQSTRKPLSEVRQNLRIKWYRCPIEPPKLRELSRRNDLKGFSQALGHLGLWIVTGLLSYLFLLKGSWFEFGVAIFLHGTVGSFFTAAHHELSHGTVFETKRLNTIFLSIFSLLGWLNFRVYKMSHTYHHRFTLFPEGDKEEVHPKTPSLHFLYLIQLLTVNITGGEKSRGIIPTVKNFVMIAFNNLDNPMNDWDEALYDEVPEEGIKAVNWARLVLAFHLAIIFFSFVIGQPIIAVLVSGHLFIGNLLYYFVGTPMHCGLRTNVPDFRKCVRNMTLDPISEFLYWNMNWHLNHHMFAAVPCYNLKKLYQLIADDLPNPKNLLVTWREMREIMRKQQKDPNYEYDTPVPPPRERISSEQKKDIMAESIGELAPKAIA